MNRPQGTEMKHECKWPPGTFTDKPIMPTKQDACPFVHPNGTHCLVDYPHLHYCDENVDSHEVLKRLMSDQVNHPSHYNSHPAGIECIDVIEHMPFNVGSAMKYLWRAGLKSGEPLEQDMRKAVWYVEREIVRRKKTAKPEPLQTDRFLGKPISYWKTIQRKLEEHMIEDPSQITKILR